MEQVFKKIFNNYSSFLIDFIKTNKLKKIAQNDIPLYSPWPERLLGLKSFKIHYKNEEEIIREYDNEKWKEKLDFYYSLKKKPSFIDFRDSNGNEIAPRFILGGYYLLPEKDYNYLQSSLLYFLLKELKAKTVIELGAGYGAMLLDLASRKEFSEVYFKGGDISQNAVKLIKFLASDLKLKVESKIFNFLETDSYSMIDKHSIVYTSHSLMYLPHIGRNVLENLIKTRPKLVVNLEPIFPVEAKTLSDLMIQKYIQLNDYNKNLMLLLEELKKNNKIKILFNSGALLGNNPFIPFSVVIWEPK